MKATPARRVASITGTVAVTAIAAVASYDHTRAVAEAAGQPPLLAALLPLSVDGMILVATLALGDGRRSRWSAWLAFLVGVAASLAANVMAADSDAVSRAVSAWPAIALLLTVEVLARSGHASASAATANPATPPAPVAIATAAAAAAASNRHGEEAIPATAPAKVTARPRRTRTAPAASTAARVAAIVAEKPSATAADVAEAVGCAPRTARRHLAAIRGRDSALSPRRSTRT